MINQTLRLDSETQRLWNKLKGPYFGQKPPGNTAELFATQYLSLGDEISMISFSRNGLECAYTVRTGACKLLSEPCGYYNKTFILSSKYESGHWTEPTEFPFSYSRLARYPFFSHDGNRIYFNLSKEVKNNGIFQGTSIFYSERKANKWGKSQEIVFDNEINGSKSGIYPSVASNGNLYFTVWPKGQNKGIFCVSKLKNGRYSTIEILPGKLNEIGGIHPYIAPDESYLIYDGAYSKNRLELNNDLCISFRDEDGNWSRPFDLGEGINSPYHEMRPFVSFDGKYLFFASNRIKNNRIPDRPVSIWEIRENTINPNGHQNIYWVKMDKISHLRKKFRGA